MRFHRLTVRNFRGIDEHTVEFPSTGVLVVEGPNEAGKSSLVEAIDLLFRFKDSSSNRVVTDTHPIGRDEAPFVELEAEVGPYRFVYGKRWAKKGGGGVRGRGGETTLKVSAPRTENFTGVAAHEEAERIVEEHLDTALWQALRLMQGTELAPVQLGSSAMLRAALDAAAGSGAHAGGEGDSLVEEVESEYIRYFTPATGRPKGEYEKAVRELEEARAAHQDALDAVHEVEQSVQRHAALVARIGSLESALAEAEAVRDRLAEQQALAVKRAEELKEAETALADAARNHADAVEAAARRAKLVDDVGQRAETCERAVSAHEEAQRLTEAKDAEAETARAAADTAGEQSDRARRSLEKARELRLGASLVAERNRLAKRVEQVAQLTATLVEARATLATLRVDEKARERVERAERALEQAQAAQKAASASVFGKAVHDSVKVLVNGADTTLTGSEQEWVLTESMTVTVPEVAEFRLVPAAGAAQRADAVEQAERALRSLLAELGVGSADEAYRQAVQRQQLEASIRQHQASRDAVLAGDEPGALTDRLAELRHLTATDSETESDTQAENAVAAGSVGTDAGGVGTAENDDSGVGAGEYPEGVDAAAEVAEPEDDGSDAALAVLVAAEQQAREHEARLRGQAERAREAAAEAAKAATAAEVEVTAGRRELAVRARELDEARGTATDEALARAVEASADAKSAAQVRRDEAARLAVESDREQERFEAAERRVAGAKERLVEADRERAGLEAVLEQVGSQGRAERVDEAAAAFEAALRAHRSVARRAAAAKLLRDTLRRHRDEASAAYVAPFREAVERLGRSVYGSSFEVVVGPDLLVEERVLHGVNVPFDSLSSGAKEQLSILVRLAVAQLVDPAGGVPVVIDDALGYSDPERLLAVTAAFGAVAADVQVVMLTCTPGRYDGVAGATTVRLAG